MRDLHSTKAMWLKGWLFLTIGLTSVAILLVENWNWRAALLLARTEVMEREYGAAYSPLFAPNVGKSPQTGEWSSTHSRSVQTSASASSNLAIKSAVSSRPADTRMSQRLTPTLSVHSSSS